jgi:hypothetical protein
MYRIAFFANGRERDTEARYLRAGQQSGMQKSLTQMLTDWLAILRKQDRRRNAIKYLQAGNDEHGRGQRWLYMQTHRLTQRLNGMVKNPEEYRLSRKVRNLLDKVPGQSVKEIATKLGVNRTFLAGYLQSMEESGYVSSREVGPARVYYNKRRRVTE